RRSDPRVEAFSIPRHRRHRLPRSRPRRDRIPVRARDAVRGFGDQRRDHGRARGGSRALPPRDRRVDRTLPARARGARHRLSAARHESPARARAAVVPLYASEGVLMLSFLSPLFLIGAAAAAVPIVLHLLKREPETRVKLAAVRLLKQAPVEHTQNRHLRELILLALRVAALVLLALAFARPI